LPAPMKPVRMMRWTVAGTTVETVGEGSVSVLEDWGVMTFSLV
jgi:hypothetical protein